MIPARSGSKGVIDKNIKSLGGKPLIAWSIEASLKAGFIDRTIVTTDSEKYAAVSQQYGAETPFLRPAEIAGDKSTDTECFKHFLDWFQENEGGVPEYVVHLRPTTPLRKPGDIDTALELIKQNPDATALRSVHEMSETAYKCIEIKNNLLKPMGSDSFDMDIANLPRQTFPKTYSANGYVDILKPENFAATNKFHGVRVLPFITPLCYEVDTLEDFEMIEFKLKDL